PAAPGPPAPAPVLWLRPGQPHPHELTGTVVRQAVAADVRGTALLPQVLTAAVLDVALDITRDLEDVRALTRALASDFTARAHSRAPPAALMPAPAHALVLPYAHAPGLPRSAALPLPCAASPDLIRDLDLAHVRALAEAVARDLSGAIEAARARAIELAE